MNKIFLLIPALFITVAVAGQEKKATDDPQEKKNQETIKVMGYADTMIDPSYADIYISKQYRAKDADDNSVSKVEQELKEKFSNAGVDINKLNFSSNFNNFGAGRKGDEMVQMSMTVHLSDISKIAVINKVLGDMEYNIMTTMFGIDDGMLNMDAIDKTLLSRALQNGRDKASNVAEQLGVKNYRMVNFNEQSENDRRNNYTSRSRGSQVEKIKIEKKVVMIYRVD